MTNINELELESIGYMNLTNEELKNIDGGNIWGKVIDWVVGYIAGEIAEGLQRPCPCHY